MHQVAQVCVYNILLTTLSCNMLLTCWRDLVQRFGAEKVIKTGAVDNVDFDIEEVLAAGKQKTAELTQKLKEMAGSSMVILMIVHKLVAFTSKANHRTCTTALEYLCCGAYVASSRDLDDVRTV